MSTSTRAKHDDPRWKMEMNLGLLAIVFTLFTFVIAVNPALFRENRFLSIQLVLAIPLFCSSIFARGKLAHSEHATAWDTYGFLTFIFAYGFLVNSVGILLSTLADPQAGLVFWAANILSAIVYSLIEIRSRDDVVGSKVLKDSIFVLILVIFGIVPILGML